MHICIYIYIYIYIYIRTCLLSLFVCLCVCIYVSSTMGLCSSNPCRFEFSVLSMYQGHVCCLYLSVSVSVSKYPDTVSLSLSLCPCSNICCSISVSYFLLYKRSMCMHTRVQTHVHTCLYETEWYRNRHFCQKTWRTHKMGHKVWPRISVTTHIVICWYIIYAHTHTHTHTHTYTILSLLLLD